MVKRIITATLVAAALGLGVTTLAAQQPAPPDSVTMRALQDLAMQWQKLANARDAAGVAALYAPDARFYNETTAAQGRDAIKLALTGMFPMMKDFAIEPDGPPQVAGNVAYGTGTYRSMGLMQGKEMPMSGRWLTIMARQPDGSWLIARHMSVPLKMVAK